MKLRRITLADDPLLDTRDLWPYSPFEIWLWPASLTGEVLECFS